MTNYLADELRQILGYLDATGPGHEWESYHVARNQLATLTERVEAFGSEPVEVDASTDLTVTSGLEPEQEIRDRGLERAIDLYAPTVAELADVWKLADQCAAYIRDGSRPA